jgi:hypothetical protein
MRVLAIGVLSIFSLVAMFAVGSALGGAYKDGSGITGVAKALSRDAGLVAQGAQPPSSPSLGTAPRSISAGGASATSSQNPQPSFAEVSRALSGDTHGSTTPASQTTQRRWRQVTYWAGRGDKQTEPFVIAGPNWHLNWSLKNSTEMSAKSVKLSVYDSKNLLVAEVSNPQGLDADTSEVPAGPGRHVVRVDSANLDRYVAVEEQR